MSQNLNEMSNFARLFTRFKLLNFILTLTYFYLLVLDD